MDTNLQATTDLYQRAFHYANGLSTDITVFTGAMWLFLRDRIWQTGWIDKVHGQLVCTPTLKEFIENRVPKGIGQSVGWTYAALKTAAELGEEKATEAIGYLDAQIKAETGETAAAIHQRMVAAAVPVLPDPSKGGRGKKTPPNRLSLNSGSTRTDMTLARLKRDHPELAAKVVNGDLSANAAAIEAGFRKPPAPLTLLRRAWKRATEEERETFRVEIKPEDQP